MAHGKVTDEELAQLIQRTAEAASALIGGDIRRYLTLIKHTDDYTLMAPSGGEPRRGFDASDEALEAMARYFQGGEADLQVFRSYTSEDMVVLVAIERQHGEIGGLPDQDWSLWSSACHPHTADQTLMDAAAGPDCHPMHWRASSVGGSSDHHVDTIT